MDFARFCCLCKVAFRCSICEILLFLRGIALMLQKAVIARKSARIFVAIHLCKFHLIVIVRQAVGLAWQSIYLKHPVTFIARFCECVNRGNPLFNSSLREFNLLNSWQSIIKNYANYRLFRSLAKTVEVESPPF